MVMNPMGFQSVKKSPTKQIQVNVRGVFTYIYLYKKKNEHHLFDDMLQKKYSLRKKET